jgi:hypothetical protein
VSFLGNMPPTQSRWGRTAALRDSYRGWKSVLAVVLPFVAVFGVILLLWLLPARSH